MVTPSADRTNETRALVDHLFRRQYAELVSTLTKILGPSHLELAEDVVSEALLKALRNWSFNGLPQSPAGWIVTVARNLALDRLRHQRMARERLDDVADQLDALTAADSTSPTYRYEMSDDMLRMMFACCHPSLPGEASVALILRDLCGLSTREIAAAYLEKDATVAQRLVRAKQRFKTGVADLALPDATELPSRLDNVLSALYLLFSEGYAAHAGDMAMRPDLCAEAIRLVDCLVHHPIGNRPAGHALHALFLLQASRLPMRIDRAGMLVDLAAQDRSLRDDASFAEGMRALRRAVSGTEIFRYHLMAFIAAQHAQAESFEQTDWAAIVESYDQLVEIDPSPVVALNRAIAVSYRDSAEAGLALVDSLAGLPQIERYYLYHASRADLLRRLDRHDEARRAAATACSLTGNAAERMFLTARYQLD